MSALHAVIVLHPSPLCKLSSAGEGEIMALSTVSRRLSARLKIWVDHDPWASIYRVKGGTKISRISSNARGSSTILASVISSFFPSGATLLYLSSGSQSKVIKGKGGNATHPALRRLGQTSSLVSLLSKRYESLEPV
ncbi:hypothetical protein IE53DRAFT_215626 [Violaceomyces palustris]|uniref:Uncharacterized protein n=1 Tax=Violaceomyces palustris TaxID=1673888 RepID=A0ACD0NQD6_9BASI|nr:hypothetical protein IE53DRAFT_215626 [Violaceomyces palustris]